MSPIRDARTPRTLFSRGPGPRSRIGGPARPLALVVVGIVLASCGNRGAPAQEPAGRLVVDAGEGLPYAHLVVKGTPRWMGFEQGRLLREPIRAAVARGLLRPEVVGARTFAGPVRVLLPEALEQELQGIATGAGVLADDLFLLEVAREGRRWQSDAPGLLEASFASAPGAGAPLVIALDGLGSAALPEPLVVVERHPTHGAATLCLSWAGSLGGLLGVSAAGLAAGMGEVEVAPERRSIKGIPMAIALRLGLEAADAPEALLGRLPSLSGHRVVAVGSEGRRASALLSLVVEPVESFAPEAWLLFAAGPRTPTNPRSLALERRLAGFSGRPDGDNAIDLALAGRSAAAVGPVVRLSRAGIGVQPEVGPSGTSPGAVEAAYAWAEDAARSPK